MDGMSKTAKHYWHCIIKEQLRGRVAARPKQVINSIIDNYRDVKIRFFF